MTDISVYGPAEDDCSAPQQFLAGDHTGPCGQVGERLGLDFQSAGEAEKFLDFLQTKVWISTQNAPALASAPWTKVLEPADTASGS